MQIKEIIDYLDLLYPLSLQEDYDNAGHKVGDATQQLTGILVTLDVTDDVIDEALASGFNLVVSHHPMIFAGLKSLVPTNTQTRMLNRLIKNDICVYSAHTNLDNLPGGVSFILGEKLGVRNLKTLKPMCPGKSKQQPVQTDANLVTAEQQPGGGAIGELDTPLPYRDFVERVKRVLQLPMIKCSTNPPSDVKCVALCGGSGSFLIDEAARQHADIYLTSDIKYHDYQKAVGTIHLADIGHYESEQFAQELIYNDIIKKFSNFACRITKAKTSYIQYI